VGNLFLKRVKFSQPVRSKFAYAVIIFIVSLVTLVILSVNFQQRIRNLLQTSEEVERSDQIILELNRLENYLKDAETGQRGFLLSDDTAFLQPYITFKSRIGPTSAKLQQLSGNNLPMQNKIVRLRSLISKRMEIMQENLIVYQERDKTFFDNLRRGKVLMDSCRQLIAEIQESETAVRDKGQNLQNFYSARTPENFKLVFLFSILALVISFGLILREIYHKNQYQKELKAKIIQLNRAYDELQQVTFVTSHDFQEPLRKIRIFSNRLQVSHQDRLNTEGQLIVERINVAAGRIHELIEELSGFMNLTQSNEQLSRIEMAQLIADLNNEMKEKLSLKKAQVHIELPVTLEGYRTQLFMLFRALFDNSLKYARADVPLVISVTGNLCEYKSDEKNGYTSVKYYRITVKDNGVGFDPEFSRKIFHLFRRLHSGDSGPEGKGVGLALVERIMVNHQGYVLAESTPQEGASFHLHFPVKD
jgi:signal transduction histidine kinase